MVHTVIFDLDGTLIDTVRMTARALRELTGPLGLPAPPNAAVRSAMGLHDSEFFRALFPGADEAVLAALAPAVERREGEIGRTLGRDILFPGVAEMLSRLRARGLALYIASTGSPVHVRDMLQIAGIGELMSGVYCDEPDKRAMVGRILADSGAVRAAMVGDRDKDIAAGHANGLPVIGAGFGYAEPGEAMGFDGIAGTPEELEEMLLTRIGGGCA